VKHPIEVVLAQAEDEGLWFNAEHSTEAYLQQELRKLHKSIEDYFSPENMPSAEEVIGAANMFCADNYTLDVPSDILRSFGAYCGYVEGYKAALERMKR